MTKSYSKPTQASGEDILISLANLPDKGLARFREKWRRWYSRYSSEEILTRRDELRLFWTHRLWEYPEEPYEHPDSDLSKQTLRREQLERRRRRDEWYAQHPEAVRPMVPKRAKKIYDNWGDVVENEFTRGFGEPRPPELEQAICEHWLKQEPMWWGVAWEKNKGTIRVQLRCLPAMLAWTCIRVADRMGVCRNPKCRTRYFFVRRKDQRYCSHECARPSKRASQLRWWRENRGKRAQVGEAPVVVDGSKHSTRPQTARHVLRPPVKARS